jgi:tetratricopeptide (TPR) repeat protein
MDDYQSALQTAVSAHSRGDLESALAFCERAVSANPYGFDALHLWGFVLAQQEQHDKALERYRAARAINAGFAPLLNNLAVSALATQELEEALSAAQSARTLQSDFAPAWETCGVALAALDRHADALAMFEHAARLPGAPSSLHRNKVPSLIALGRAREAHVSAQHAIADEGRTVRALNMLALAHAANRDFQSAAIISREVLATHLGNEDALRNLVTALLGLEEFSEAHDLALRLRERHPSDPDILNNLGLAVRGEQGPRGALPLFEDAVARYPAHVQLNLNYLRALRDAGRIEDARAKATAWKPPASMAPEAAYVFGMICLGLGLMERGWAFCEQRRRLQEWNEPSLDGPEAIDAPQLTGKRLFLYSEQGLGDTVQFARYAEILAREAGSVELEVQPGLVSLLGGLRGVRVIGAGMPRSAYDFHLPLLSAPRLLGTVVETIPWEGPYICGDPVRIERWSQHLGHEGFKIGIAWQGNPHGAVDEGRSFALSYFSGIARMPGVRLISLQKNAGTEQLSGLPSWMRVETLGSDFDGGDQAFLDTAAVIANLDLVITSDTSIAHVAGAMGRPVWIALKSAPDWRWLLNRSDSPWYPSAKLFRQPQPGDWESVFGTIAKTLAAHLRQKAKK